MEPVFRNALRAGALPVLVATLSLAVVACGGVDRSDYVRKNLRLLDSLPVPTGAHVKRTESAPYQDSELPGAKTIGYRTSRVFEPAASASPRSTIEFYRRHMLGWHVEDLSEAPSISLNRGDAYVHALAGPEEVVVEVDHNCFKGGSHPRCFGP